MKLTAPLLIRHDLPRKLVAFFFALVIWASVSYQLHDYEMYHQVPVMLRYDAATMFIENDIYTVDVHLRGSSRALEKVQQGDITITASIPPIPPGIYFYELRLSPQNASSPPGTRVTEIIPDRIRVPVDRVISKRNVPIRIRLTGQLREGYKVARQGLFPPTAEVRGPSKIVRSVTEVYTEPVMLDESLDYNFEVDAKIVRIPEVEINTETVHVSFELARHTTQKSFPELPLRVLAKPDSRLRPVDPLPSVAVTLHGPQTVLDQLDASSVKPFVDLAAITSSALWRLPVHVWLPGGGAIVVDDVRPPTIEVFVDDVVRAPADFVGPPEATEEDREKMRGSSGAPDKAPMPE